MSNSYVVFKFVFKAANFVLKYVKKIILKKYEWISRISWIYLIVKDLLILFVSVSKKSIKKIYEWVFQILNNLKSLLQKMKIKFNARKPEDLEPRYKEYLDLLNKALLDLENQALNGQSPPVCSIETKSILDNLLAGLESESKSQDKPGLLLTVESIKLIKKFYNNEIDIGVADDLQPKTIIINPDEVCGTTEIENPISKAISLLESIEKKVGRESLSSSLTEIEEIANRLSANANLGNIATTVENINLELNNLLSKDGRISRNTKKDKDIVSIKNELREMNLANFEKTEELVAMFKHNQSVIKKFDDHYKQLEKTVKDNPVVFYDNMYMFFRKLNVDRVFKGW